MAATETARTALRADKRRSILDAAGPVFGDVGYERASVDAIAAAAGVSKPTIYSYFDGKEGLFRETMADIARQVNEASYDVVVSLDLRPEHWRDSLHRLGSALTACQREGCAAALSRLVLAESRRDPQVFDEVRRAGIEPIREALAGRLAMLGNAGLLDIPDPGVAAQHFIALTQAQLPELTAGGTRPGDQTVIESAVTQGVDTFLRAYSAT
ncbi:AcrR family transcriptional regulator [Microbacterium resistens]|uniref:AcrR family transcriptional regulator n=1 Tax=Microbacterium resistens TaxID=156977 RepID=A0ABU1SDE1_9MICO|nr:TetR/AcrR family transcriptional regulator [Microbacterium resistens]MDR6867614.1 AcrR family transcriptional regulator [Microbacterium resistens]